MQDRINAELSTQRSYYPIHQYGNQALSSRAPSSDPFLSIALHNALQQQLDTIASNRRSDHRRANVHPEAYSSVADSRIITNAFASQVASVLPPTSPIPSSQGLGTSSNLSVPSRLQQLLTDRSIGPPNVAAGAQSSTVGQSHPSAVLAIAALLLQVGDGRGGVLASTDGSAMSTSNSTASSAFGRDHTERAVDGTQNQATSPSVGMARPLPNLPTSQHLPFLLQDPAFLEQALPTVMRMGGSGLAQVLLSAPVRHTRADSGASSLSLCAPLGHVEDQKLPRIIYVTSDDDSLSPYQCLVRKQIQLFEASETDIHATAQGRNRPIIVGQVGIRCIHCGRLPIERRARGAVYFPSTLMSTYQTAQNMANSHLMKDCLDIPRYIREDLVRIRLRENSESQNTRKSAFGGGRAYWARGLQTNHGVIETEDQRLKFDSSSIVP